MALCKGILNLTKYANQSTCSIVIRNRSKKSERIPKMFGEEYVTPNPDPRYYDDLEINEDDEISFLKVEPPQKQINYSAFYNAELYKFEKMLIKKGRGALAQKVIRDMIEHIKLVQIEKYNISVEDERDNIELNPLTIFLQAMENAKPAVAVRSVYKDAKTYSIPTPLNTSRQFFLASSWMINHVHEFQPKTKVGVRLAEEILAAYRHEGGAIKKKQELHRLAEVNKAYANLRWTK